MSVLKILDATLRDGGHINNFHFNNEHLSTILPLLDQSDIEYIEIGYRNGSISYIENIGIAGMCPNEYILNCKKYIKHAKIAVMAHCNNITQTDVQELKDCGVSLLRLCIPKSEHKAAFNYIEYANDLGMEVSVNLIHISQYQEDAIYQAVSDLLPYKPSMIYFADSNGCLHQDKVFRIYSHCVKQFNIPFGFHGHDNIGLAQTNTLSAISAGAEFVDATLAGAGKGIGNLKIEFLIAYLYSIGVKQYKLKPLITASNYIRTTFPACGHVSIDEFTRGIYDLSTQQVKDYKAEGFK